MVNVNAGTLTLSSTLSGASSLIVRLRRTLAGGPSAAISALVTVNSNAVLIPDASKSSASLIGGNLTVNAGGVFQWAYNGPTAEGTIALGSHTLTLPSVASGLQPVFPPAVHPSGGSPTS